MSLKKEFLLEINEFNESKNYDGLLALAKLIQNLVIAEVGTYPNNPDLGIGIQQYKFEFLDDITINKIQSKIELQLAKYIPDSGVDNIVIEKSNDNNNVLGIMFTLEQSIDDENAFILAFSQSKSSSEVVSKIII